MFYIYHLVLQMSEEGFERKMEFIGSIRHPHVTELLGYCYGPSTASLASLYIPGGTLDMHLKGIIHWKYPHAALIIVLLSTNTCFVAISRRQLQ